jgi:hypothetical protein
MYGSDSDADSDMTNPFAPEPKVLFFEEVVRPYPQLFLPNGLPPRPLPYYNQTNRRRTNRHQRMDIDELEPVMSSGGLLRENGRIFRSSRLTRAESHRAQPPVQKQPL